MKRLISVVLTLLTLACISLSFFGCSGCDLGPEIETYGDFLYTVVYYDENGTHVIKEKGIRSGIVIMGLSESGQEKEIVVVPRYIAGLVVEEIGYDWFYGIKGEWESEKLKKVFVPYNVVIQGEVFSGIINLKKIVFLAHDGHAYDIEGDSFKPIFITSNNYVVDKHTTNFYERYFYHNYGVEFYFSNVSFFYNYVNAPNDNFYWIDDCDYGGRIEYIPDPPVRDGYKFGGWYKQAECIEEWNFETDTLPEAEYTEENDEVYQETKLYAKWIRI